MCIRDRDTVDINFIEVNYKKQPKYDSYKKNMKPSNSKPETRGASSLLNEPKGIREGTQMISRLFETYSLDFHGFLPSTAVELLKKALEIWWGEELSEREMNAKRSITNNKALYVKPLTVITGRGMHSVGGISKVRVQVKKYLTSNNYIFWEEPSFFTIEGKKSSK